MAILSSCERFMSRRQFVNRTGAMGFGVVASAILAACAAPASPTPTTAPAAPTTAPAAATAAPAAPTTAPAAPTVAPAAPTAAPAAPTTAPAAQASPVSQPVTLQVWFEDDTPTKDKVQEQVLKTFTDVHPGVTLVPVLTPFGDIETKLITGMAGGIQLDVLYTHPVLNATFAQKGAMVPLESYLKNSSLNLDDFFESSLLQLRYKNQLYALPYDHECTLYYYNTDGIKAANLEDPATLYNQGQWTVDKFVEYLTKLSRGTGKDRVFASQEIPKSLRVQAPYIWGYGGEVFSTDYMQTLINSPAAIQAWGFMTDFVRKGFSPTSDDMKAFPDAADGMFNSAKLIFRESIRAYVSTIKAGLPVAMVPHPVFPGGKEFTRVGNNGLGIYAKAPNRDLSWQALEYIIPRLNDGFMAASSAEPTRKSLYKSDAWKKVLLPWESATFYEKVAFSARGMFLPPNFSEIDKRAQTAYDKITLNQATVQQGMDEAKAQIDPILKQVMAG